MKITPEEINANLENPEKLEELYRDDRKAFKAAFDILYPDIKSTGPAGFWKVRMEYDGKHEILTPLGLPEIVWVIVVCIITAILIKIPAIFQIGYSDDIFFQKNAAIIVFFGLTLYSMWVNRVLETRKVILTALAFLIPAVYINLLPAREARDSVILAYIHLPLLMWFIYGIVFVGYDFRDRYKRIGFIRFNGDLLIVYALIAIAGGLLTAITIGLFDSIGLNIQTFYGENIILTGAAAAPVVAAFIIEKYPALVNRIAPLIAAIFSPLVLITLTVFLVVMLVTGKDPYNDRDFLLIFNAMLLGVMGIIIFSVTGTSGIRKQKFNTLVLFMLSIVTIVIDLIALSAIFYRLEEYGMSPNRLAVLVSNILVLINLALIMASLFRINFKGKDFGNVEMIIAKFLPVYLIWIIIVIFGFPVIF